MNISCTVVAKFGVAFGRTNSHTTTNEKKNWNTEIQDQKLPKNVKNAVDVPVLVFLPIKKSERSFSVWHGDARERERLFPFIIYLNLFLKHWTVSLPLFCCGKTLLKAYLKFESIRSRLESLNYCSFSLKSTIASNPSLFSVQLEILFWDGSPYGRKELESWRNFSAISIHKRSWSNTVSSDMESCKGHSRYCFLVSSIFLARSIDLKNSSTFPAIIESKHTAAQNPT